MNILLNWVARRAQIGGDYSNPVSSNTLHSEICARGEHTRTNLNEIETERERKRRARIIQIRELKKLHVGFVINLYPRHTTLSAQRSTAVGG